MRFHFLALLFAFSTLAQAQQTAAPPNIIFILTDDQRWDALGAAGNPLAHTPEMDKLAQNGTYFKTAMVTTPICAASRASILSGLYERTHGYNFQAGPMGERYMADAYPYLMKQAGYYTGFFGKFGVNYQNSTELFHEFDSYDRNGQFEDERGYFYKTIGKDTVHLTRYTGQQALDFIETAPGDQPFCLSLSFSAPHAHDPAEDQYFWQETTDYLYQNQQMPEPKLAADNYFDALPKAVRAGFNRTRWYWRYDTPEKYQHSVKGYYRMIAGIDLEIAKIRQQLAKKGLDKNTVIILLGDNGYFLGERQLAGKWLMYDNSVRVPLIIFDPRADKPQEVPDQVLNVDVPATMLELAGVPIPDAYHGKSLLPFVQNKPAQPKRDTVLIEHLWEFSHIPPSEGVRTNRWKYLRYVNDKSIEELYDLENDPQETRNLAATAAYQEQLQALRQKCDELIKQYSDPYSAPPQDLSVEFIREPNSLLLNDQTPEFSWEVPAEATTQSAYQLLVSSSLANSQNNIGDQWDSGIVRSSESINIAYQGKTLQQRQPYFWKVHIWDADNRTTAYSEPQQFQVGQPDSILTTRNAFQIDRVSPTAFAKKADNSYFVDFGKDAFATLKLQYQATEKETLTIHLGEQLEDGRINREPQGHIRYQAVELTVTPEQTEYIVQLPPDERNTNSRAVALPDTFPVLLPFRYAEIEKASQPITLKDIKQLAYHSYFDDSQSHFTSSDTILNQIWEMCKHTLKATTFSGLYVDGDRERIPYEADAYIQQLGHYCVDREYAIGRETIEYFMQHPTWPTEWQLHVALLFYQDYWFTGNTELIEKYYEELKHKTLLELRREDGLISSQSEKMSPAFMRKLGFTNPDERLRDIVDWPPAQKDTGWKLATEEGERDGYVFTPINTVVNAFFYKNMEIMAEFATLLGKADEATTFKLLALQAKKSINEKLFDPENGRYVDGEGTNHASLHANMLPLTFGIVPEKHVPSVLEFIKSRGMACSVYGAQYLMEGIYNAGAADYALELLTATHDRSWYNMIKVGATMAMEAWDMKYKPNADWNHAWGAVPANAIPRGLWGITPATPGFGVVQIQPQLGDLESSSIVFPTLRGKIKASYQFISDRRQRYDIELPANVVGEFVLPATGQAIVRLNGEKVNTAFGSVRLQPGENVVELVVNSF